MFIVSLAFSHSSNTVLYYSLQGLGIRCVSAGLYLVPLRSDGLSKRAKRSRSETYVFISRSRCVLECKCPRWDTVVQRWSNAGPTSATLPPHWIDAGFWVSVHKCVRSTDKGWDCQCLRGQSQCLGCWCSAGLSCWLVVREFVDWSHLLRTSLAGEIFVHLFV